MYFAKMRKDVIIPSKIDENVGFDIYANFESDALMISPGRTIMIPTGIVSAFSKEYGVILKERGSTGSKGMALRCGVVDSGYRGEWFVGITNTTDRMMAIMKKGCTITLPQNCIVYPYEKAIAQAVVIKLPEVKLVEKSLEEVLEMASERGTGKLGSSGK